MCRKKTILITLFLCLAGSMTSLADVIVYENDFEDPCQVDALSGWNWADAGQVHNVVYADYDGNMVVEHTGTIDNSAGAADINTRFGSKWGIELSGNTSTDPNDYTIEFDIKSVSGDWDPIGLEFFVLPGDQGYGSGISEYAQADGWVHVAANLADLTAGWWAGTAWDVTLPSWQIELGGPAWPGASVPAGTPAWDQIWLMDNLKITMISLAEPVDPGTEGLVAYYAFENDANDSSGNGFNGTIFGDPNFVEGIAGMALDFDGDGDYIDCGNDPNFDITDKLTVATWVNIRSIPQAWSAVVNKGDSAWRISNNGTTTGMHFGFENGTRGWQAANSATQLNLSEWYHVCGVYDTSVGAKIYINGAEDGSNPDKEGITISTYNVWIGDNSQTSDRRYWDGLIDELKIYDRALSVDEVRYLAGERAPVVPVHSYTFEDGTANDSVGGADGVLVGGAEVIDGAMVTFAQDQWMEMPGDVIAMGTYPEVTIEAWYTPTAGANTGWSMLAYFGDNVNDMGNDGFFITSARGDDKSRAAISCGNTSAPYSAESGADGPEYDDGLLHHMVSTINATDITLYIDGVLMASTPLSETNSISCISPNLAYLAKGGYGGDPEWIGAIEEFNIYDVALTEAQVAANYAAGPQRGVNPGTEGLMAYYPLDNDLIDASGNGYDGTAIGDPTFVGGVAGMAMEFDGNDCVDTGYTEDLATWTMSAWVMSPEAPAALPPSGPVHREQNYQINWNHVQDAWRGAVGMSGGGWYSASLGPLEANTWYHLAGTYDGEDLKAYTNGFLISTNSDPSGSPAAESNSLKLARHAANATQFFTGTVDEVRIYNRALSDAEVLYLASN